MLFGYVPVLVTKNYNLDSLLARKGLLLPPDIFGLTNVSQVCLDAIDAALTVDPNVRATPQQVRKILNCQPLDGKKFEHKIKVVLAGEFGTGKTSILRQMAHYYGSEPKGVVYRLMEVDGKVI